MAVVFEFRSREFRKKCYAAISPCLFTIHLASHVPIGNKINQAKEDSSDREEILKF